LEQAGADHALSSPLRGGLGRAAQAPRRARHGDLTCFEQLLEAPQIILDLLARFFTEQLREEPANPAARSRVFQVHAYLSPSRAWSRDEANAAAVRDRRPFDGAPGEQ